MARKERRMFWKWSEMDQTHVLTQERDTLRLDPLLDIWQEPHRWRMKMRTAKKWCGQERHTL